MYHTFTMLLGDSYIYVLGIERIFICTCYLTAYPRVVVVHLIKRTIHQSHHAHTPTPHPLHSHTTHSPLIVCEYTEDTEDVEETAPYSSTIQARR